MTRSRGRDGWENGELPEVELRGLVRTPLRSYWRRYSTGLGALIR